MPLFILAIALFCLGATVHGGQGVQRLLYTAPNTTFIENPSGDGAITINDNSGSIASVQAAIGSVRSTNANGVIVVNLLNGATYTVSSASLVLGAHECLVASGATIQAASSAVTVPLIQITSGATNVSIAGGTLDGGGANINAIEAPATGHANIDLVTVKNCGLDGILMNGKGNSTYDSEIAISRCDVSGCATHAGINIQNSTQTACVDNNCHNNAVGITISAAWANIANNSCENNTTGIAVTGGDDDVIANNTCNYNGTGIQAGGTKNMIISNSTGNNSVAGIGSSGSSNTFADNLFTAGNAVNFSNGGSSDNVVAYKAALPASGQNYFYPPLVDNQHTNTTIVNGMGRTDLMISSTSIDSVQSQYNSAVSANPNNVIVLHLNGTFTVGATPLTLTGNACVLLNGTIVVNSSTTASAAILCTNTPRRISISGGTIDAGNKTKVTGISVVDGGTIQVDGMSIQNFGSNATAVSGSDSIHFSGFGGGATPLIVTRCYINGSAGRAVWSQLPTEKGVYCANTCIGTRAGIDCDSHTFGAVLLFNTILTNTYGLWYEQGASHDTSIGNVCNYNQRYQLDVGNNTDTPPTEYNNYICNVGEGNTGLVTAAVGTNTYTSYNFLFNNVILNATISSKPAGTNNYYSQNYLSGGTLSTSGSETFFNSSDGSGNLPVVDSNSGLNVLVSNAATTNSAPVVIGTSTGQGNEQWQFVPTHSGFCKVIDKNSGLAMVVQNAATTNGAPIVQFAYSGDSTYNDEWTIQAVGNGLYNFVNRLSGLYLDVPGGSTSAGTQLDQRASSGAASQQFSVFGAPITVPQPFVISANPSSQSVTAGSNTVFTVNLVTNSGFTGTVTFSVSGLPANTMANFAPATLSTNGSATMTVSTSASTPAGIYPLTIMGVDGTVTNTAAVTLVVTSSASGLPGLLVWTSGSGTDTNWITAQNWTNVTGGGFGPPGPSNTVYFTNTAAVTSSAIVPTGSGVVVTGNINSYAGTSFTIQGLTNLANAASTSPVYQNIGIANGATLSVSGNMQVGGFTQYLLGDGRTVNLTISGAGGTLQINGGALTVSEDATNSGANNATLDLSGLDNFVMNGTQIRLGVEGSGSAHHASGIIYLARTNVLLWGTAGYSNVAGANSPFSGNPALYVGHNVSAFGNGSQLYLGVSNALFFDYATVGRGDINDLFAFNPHVLGLNPSVYIRGTNGDASRVGVYVVGDGSAGAQSNNAPSTNDFTGGSVDALVDYMCVGRGRQGSASGVGGSGVLTFNQGTINVNNLALGFIYFNGSNSPATGTVNVNGTGTLVVNSNLTLSSQAVTTNGVRTLGNGTLNLNGGTLQANTIVNGGGVATITASGGTLVLVNTMGTPSSGIGSLNVTNSAFHLSLDGNALVTNMVVTNLNAGGQTAIDIDSVTNVTGTNQFHLISYNAFNGSLANFALGTVPVRFTGVLSNNAVNHSIDLVVAKAPVLTPGISSTLYSAADGTLTISGTNGNAGFSYYVLTSTNVALPLSNWSVIDVDAFDPSGNFTFIVYPDPTVSPQFYRLQVP